MFLKNNPDNSDAYFTWVLVIGINYMYRDFVLSHRISLDIFAFHIRVQNNRVVLWPTLAVSKRRLNKSVRDHPRTILGQAVQKKQPFVISVLQCNVKTLPQ